MSENITVDDTEKNFCTIFSNQVKSNSSLHILPDGITLSEFLEQVSTTKVYSDSQIGFEKYQNKESFSKPMSEYWSQTLITSQTEPSTFEEENKIYESFKDSIQSQKEEGKSANFVKYKLECINSIDADGNEYYGQCNEKG